MKAVCFQRFGIAHEVAELVDQPDPGQPCADEVLIAVVAAPVNPADLLRLAGLYGNARPTLPGNGGAEGIGRIVAVGDQVTDLAVGDLVLLHQNFIGTGTWRESVRAPAEKLCPVAEGDIRQLAMLTVNPATAWLMLTDYVSLNPGDWVIQNAANSATGHWLNKLADQIGVNVINVVRRADAAEELKSFGTSHVVIDDGDGDVSRLAADIASLTGGVHPRLAIDAIAGAATGRLASVIADGGVVVNYGLLSSRPCQVAPHDTVFRDISLRGFWLQRWWNNATRQQIRDLYANLAGMVARGELSVPVEAVYPLDQVSAALQHAARPGRVGKVLLSMT